MARTVIGRIGQLVRANVSALLDGADDPEKMLDQLLRDFSASIAEAESAVAQTVGNLRLLEDDRDEAREAAEEWGRKAAAAAARAEQLAAEGSPDADRFTELARVALRRQIGYEKQVETFSTQIAQQEGLATQLRSGLDKVRAKHEDLVRRRDELVSRARAAEARTKMHESVHSVLDPGAELGRFEEHVRRQEAEVLGMEEVSAYSLEAQREGLEELGDDTEVQRRLDALRASGS
ncbi:MAG TPA: PspA/IM30 family protein [Egibacteraceae bacterium]|nr:PspA/IM30 family protein [Egibacteraceae bacterium]